MTNLNKNHWILEIECHETPSYHTGPRAHFYETYTNNTRSLRLKRKTKSFKITIYTFASKVSSHTFHDSYHIIILKQVYSIYTTTPNPVEEHGCDTGPEFWKDIFGNSKNTPLENEWRTNPKVMEVDGSNDCLFFNLGELFRFQSLLFRGVPGRTWVWIPPPSQDAIVTQE